MESAQISTEIAGLKGQLTALLSSIKRIEDAMVQIASMDKSLSNIELKQTHLESHLRDIEHNEKNLRQYIASVNDALTFKVDNLSTNYNGLVNRFDGGLRMGKIMYGIAGFIVTVSGAWVYDRAEGNRSLNLKQEQAIALIEKDLDFVKDALLSTRNRLTEKQ